MQKWDLKPAWVQLFVRIEFEFLTNLTKLRLAQRGGNVQVIMSSNVKKKKKKKASPASNQKNEQRN